MPPAPPTFSTTTCWPSTSLSPLATIRPRRSVPPPRGNGITMVTGRSGQVCAVAGLMTSPNTATAKSTSSICLMACSISPTSRADRSSIGGRLERFQCSGGASRRRRVALRRFLHHRQGMAVGILEEGHPEIVIVHLRNQARAEPETDSALFEFRHGQDDVGTAEVDTPLRPELVGLLHLVEEQAHAGTVEEREVAETVEPTQADHLLVKGFRAIGIDDRQSDLADLAEVEQHVELPNGTDRIIGASVAHGTASAQDMLQSVTLH